MKLAVIPRVIDTQAQLNRLCKQNMEIYCIWVTKDKEISRVIPINSLAMQHAAQEALKHATDSEFSVSSFEEPHTPEQQLYFILAHGPASVFEPRNLGPFKILCRK